MSELDLAGACKGIEGKKCILQLDLSAGHVFFLISGYVVWLEEKGADYSVRLLFAGWRIVSIFAIFHYHSNGIYAAGPFSACISGDICLLFGSCNGFAGKRSRTQGRKMAGRTFDAYQPDGSFQKCRRHCAAVSDVLGSVSK